ncbi:dienelactone hydrolase family protein [Falsiroseomonas sp. HW251]|uniref:dienelactone hydrolase family protein n=1 Tax=Falsiroseomonas sp. HW251 TaxID=3390998 RepID=UPI003D3113D1
MKRLLLAMLLLCPAPPAPRAQPAAERVAIWVPGPDYRQVVLGAELLRPPGPGPFPAVVLLHDCLGVTADEERWAERLSGWGYVALLLHRFDVPGFDTTCRGEMSAAAAWQPIHAEAAQAWLVATRPEVRPDRIGVLGWGQGGSAALLLVHGSPEPHGRPFSVAVALHPGCRQPNPLRDMEAPLLLLVGSEDVFPPTMAPAAHCARMAARREGRRDKPLELVVYRGAQSGFDREGIDLFLGDRRFLHDPAAAEDAVVRIRAFIGRYLGD